MITVTGDKSWIELFDMERPIVDEPMIDAEANLIDAHRQLLESAYDEGYRAGRYDAEVLDVTELMVLS